MNKYEEHRKLLTLRKRYYTQLVNAERVNGKESLVRDLQNKLIDNFRKDIMFDWKDCVFYNNSNIKISKICFACMQKQCPISIHLDKMIDQYEGTHIPDITSTQAELPKDEEIKERVLNIDIDIENEVEPDIKKIFTNEPKQMTEKERILSYRNLNTKLMGQCSAILEDVVSTITLLNASLAANVQEEIKLNDPDYIFYKFK